LNKERGAVPRRRANTRKPVRTTREVSMLIETTVLNKPFTTRGTVF
jgi:hypothetical protein